MKQILLKTGILLFCYTLIISNHIEKSEYVIFSGLLSTAEDDRKAIKEDEEFIVPYKKYISNEKYLSFLSTYPSHLRNHVIANSTEKILPFENKNNFYLTIFFLISVTIIIVSIDINDKSVVNKKVLLLSIPLLFYFFQSFNISNQIPLTVTNADTESDISIIKRDINNLESNQSDLKGRVNDLEY
jgi:hypothetical protein